MEQDDDQCTISNEAENAAYDSVITDLLADRPVLDKIIDDNLLAEAICVTTSNELVENIVNQTCPALECGLTGQDDCDLPKSIVPVVEATTENDNMEDNEMSNQTDEEDVDESSEEPAVKRRRRIVTPTRDDDDDDSVGMVDEEEQSPFDMPIVVESSELNEERETPKPKCKKASTIMLKEIQARVLLEGAIMISADTTCRKKKNRILDSDEDENDENILGSTDNGMVNDISDIGLDSNNPAADYLNPIDVHCNEIRGDEIQEVYISHQQNHFDIGTEIETCKLDYEHDGSGIGSDDETSKHSNSYDSPDEEAPDPMAGIFETDPSDSSQGEEIFGHDPQSENEFMTTSDVEKSRRLGGGSENDRSSESDAKENVKSQLYGDSDIEEGEIRLNQVRLKLPSTTTSDNESVKSESQSHGAKSEKKDSVIGDGKPVDQPSIKIIDVRTINDIVNSVDSSLISHDNNLENYDINSNNHSNASNNKNHNSKGSSSKSHSKNRSNQDPFFDYSTSSSSDDFIPNEIYFGSPDLLARHQRRRARRKESRRNNHKHKRRTNFYEATSSSSSDTDSMDGRYSKKYFPHNNRSKANAKNKKRKKRKDDRFYDRSRDIPPEVYFGDVQVPLHVLHSYGATSNSNPGSSDSDSSGHRKNNKSTNRGGRSHNSNTNNNNNNNNNNSNNNNRRSATVPSRSRRYSSSSSISTVNSIVSPSRDNVIETMKRYLKAAGIMRQIKLNRLWEGCKSNKERADKILEVLREKGLEGEPTMAKCKELKIRLQTKKELEELNPNVIIVTEGNANMRRARRSTTRAATEKSLQTNPLELTVVAPDVAPPIPTEAVDNTTPIECSSSSSSTLIKLKNVIDPDSD